MTKRIAVVLPRKEIFARDRFGATALTAEAYARHSRYRTETEILGMPVAEPRDPEIFRAVSPRDAWWRRRNIGFAAGCAGYLAKAPPTHIDVHNRVEVFFFLAKRFPDAAVTLWLHNDPQDTRGAYTVRERRHILERARHVVCVSNWVRARFIDGVTDAPDRVVVLPEGVDTKSVTPAAKVKWIVYAGRIIPEKGVLPLAHALARALPELPGWRASIVGAGNDKNDYATQVAAAIQPVVDRVALPGFAPHEEIMAAFARAAIAIIPSEWQEAFGRTALEAMAAGCATIASKRGGLPEIVGDAGVLVGTPDAESLSAAILSLARDDDRRAQLQEKARARAVANFDIRDWAARLDDLRG